MCQSVHMQSFHFFHHILVVLGHSQGVEVLMLMARPLEALAEWVREVLPFQRLGEAGR